MRVRFAPCPTGALHIGGARTALYNWLLARGTRRHARPAHRGHRPRALDARERRADPRRAALARARLGRGPDLADRRAPTATRRCSQQLLDERPGLPLARPRATTSRPTRREHGADRGFRGERRGRGRRAPARARRGRDRRPRPHPRRHDLPARPPRRPGDRPRRRQRPLQLRGRRSTTSTRGSRTSSAARTTSPTRPSSCSCSRRSARRAAALRAPAAAARPRRQEALQAPRRGVGPGAARRRLPARGGAQLPRAARLGRRRRRDAHLDADELVERFDIDARVAQPGALRRAEAALDERPLPARAAPTTS